MRDINVALPQWVIHFLINKHLLNVRGRTSQNNKDV